MLKKSVALPLLIGLLITACSDDKGAQKQPEPTAAQEKAVQQINKAFAKRDANSDGAISRKEFINFATARAESKPPKIDTNSDATVSQEEYTSALAKMRERLAAQGISAEEITARIAKQYASLDIDKDGSVTTAEFAQRMAARQFKKKDSNGDKQLSPEEFLTKPAQKTQAAAPAAQDTVTK